MRIQFTYTLDDLQEGLNSTDAAETRGQRSGASAAVRWVAFFVLAALLFTFLKYWNTPGTSPGTAPDNPPADLVLDLITTMAPAAVILLILVLALSRSWRNSRWSPRKPEAPAKSGGVVRLVVVYAALILLVCAVLLLLNPNATLLWYATRGELVLLRIGPWVLIFVLLIVSSLLYRQWQPRQQWFANPAYRREKVLELDDLGLRLSDSASLVQFKWEVMTKARETRNLLLLIAEDKRRWMIPKRAFRDESELDHARALIQNKVADSRFLVKPGGFAVLPKPVIPVSEEHSG